jgi:hypothetical protein
LRVRLASLLDSARLLHQRMMELRALQQAGEAGDTTAPVELGGILADVQADLAPVAESKQVTVHIACAPARVRGNSARLRDGLFHLLDFLLRRCPEGRTISVCNGREPKDGTGSGFRVINLVANTYDDADDGLRWRDLGWRMAERMIHAAGGDLVAERGRGDRVRVRLSLRQAE